MKLALRIVGAIVLVAALAWIVDLHALARTLRRADPLQVAGGVALTFVGLAITTRKWQCLLRARGIDVTWRALYRLTLIGQLYGTILPGQLAGEAVKTVRLVRGREQRAALAASVFVDRLTGLVGLLALGVAGVIARAHQTPAAVTVLLAGALAGLLVLLVVSMSMPTTDRRVGPVATHRAQHIVMRLARALRGFRSTRVLTVACVLGLAYQAVLTSSTLMLARSVDVHVSFWILSWVFAIVSIIQIVPITIAGLGAREGAFVGLLATVGVSNEHALAISMLVFGTLVLQAVAGAACELHAPTPPQTEPNPGR